MAVETHILTGELPPLDTLDLPDTGGADGAELIFHGRVRQLEHGEPIIALDYEHYAGMAESQLRAVADDIATRFPISDLLCWHRVGRVLVGHSSLRVLIRAPHRQESLDAMSAFIIDLKAKVPIWKWGVTADGKRFPS